MLALILVALDQAVVGAPCTRIIADLNEFEHYAWVTTACLPNWAAMIPVIGKLEYLRRSGSSSPGGDATADQRALWGGLGNGGADLFRGYEARRRA